MLDGRFAIVGTGSKEIVRTGVAGRREGEVRLLLLLFVLTLGDDGCDTVVELLRALQRAHFSTVVLLEAATALLVRDGRRAKSILATADE